MDASGFFFVTAFGLVAVVVLIAVCFFFGAGLDAEDALVCQINR